MKHRTNVKLLQLHLHGQIVFAKMPEAMTELSSTPNCCFRHEPDCNSRENEWDRKGVGFENTIDYCS
jgi:hypothetical protein